MKRFMPSLEIPNSCKNSLLTTIPPAFKQISIFYTAPTNRHGKPLNLFPEGKQAAQTTPIALLLTPHRACLKATCFLADCHHTVGEAAMSLTVYNGCNLFILGEQTAE